MTYKKFLVFDAGPLISLTLNGLLLILEKLKEQNPEIAFILPTAVRKEVIDNPMKIKKYMLEAVKINSLLEKGVLLDSSKFIDNNALSRETKRIRNLSNELIKIEGKKVELIHEGEASCMAFVSLIKKECLIILDERTTRLISEDPQNLAALMERKVHTDIELIRDNLDSFKKFKYIRSTELVYLAFKREILDLPRNKETLEALMFGLKYKGTAITTKEIQDLKKLAL